MLEVSFSAENKSFIIRGDDLKIIWWLVLFTQDLGILILTRFPKLVNLSVLLYVTCTI